MTIKARLFGVVFGLVIAAAIAGGVAIFGFQSYRSAVAETERNGRIAVLAERANGLIYAVVMESRGIYMSSEPQVLARFAQNQDTQLAAFEKTVESWAAAARADDPAATERLLANAADFIKLRKALAAAGRAQGNAAARAIGDNDANRQTRQRLNTEMAALADINQKRIATAAAEVDGLKNQFTILIGITIVFAFAAAALAIYTVLFDVARPLSRLTAVVIDVAAGRTEVEVSDADRKDEIGALASSVHVFRDAQIARAALEAAAREERLHERERQAAMDRMITSFRTSISNVINAVEVQSKSMRANAETLNLVSGRAHDKARSAKSAASDVAENVHLVSSAATELNATIDEIARQVHSTRERVNQASEVVEATDRDVSGLSDLADKIGAIVGIIGSIAEKTNLLALNATIEAARAGEAGKGFAVVASEVKQLAAQTGTATSEISKQITAVQAAIKGAVGSIGGITATFNEIDTLTRTIENAISEQNTATARIASAISQAASGSREAEADVTEVSVSIDETNGEADQVRGSTDLLAEVVEKLNVTVDRFLEDISKDVKERRSSTRRLSKDGILITAKGQRIPTKLADISDTGAKFECSGEMKEMDRFTLELEDGSAVRATVIWVKNGFAGARFDHPMSAEREAA